MKVAELLKVIEDIAPQSGAESWDNPGLLAGDPAWEARGVLLCVDATAQAVDEAQRMGANVILAHHPLIFGGVRTLREDQPMGALLARLVRGRIALIAAHTNLDKAPGGVNDCLADALGLRVDAAEEYLRAGSVEEQTLGQLAARLRQGIAPQAAVYGDPERRICRAACSCGAGGEFYARAAELGAQAFVTGEMKHHERIAAQALGLAVVMLGHGESERAVLEPLAARLKQRGFDASAYAED